MHTETTCTKMCMSGCMCRYGKGFLEGNFFTYDSLLFVQPVFEKCKNGIVMAIHRLQCLTTILYIAADCRAGDIRLVDGQTEREGRVEMCKQYEIHTPGDSEVHFESVWGTVCDNQWSSVHTTTLCRYLGFAETGEIHVHVSLCNTP